MTSRPTNPDARDLLKEILGHLGAARVQLIPTDDQIVAGHVIAAHNLAKTLWVSGK